MSLLGKIETIQMLIKQLIRFNTDFDVEKQLEKLLEETSDLIEIVTGERRIPW